jgi:(p)ppGpp synthase/HD superfamily hydrolase
MAHKWKDIKFKRDEMTDYDYLIDDAVEFANEAHGDQVRKYTGEPYFNHVFSVAERVSKYTTDPIIYMAALLHDTVEDTDVTLKDIGDLFGPRVAEIVYDLTDHFTAENYPHLNREKRKALETARMATVDDDVKLIKLCDLADNTSTIVEHDPGFAKVYLKEKAALLEAMGY